MDRSCQRTDTPAFKAGEWFHLRQFFTNPIATAGLEALIAGRRLALPRVKDSVNAFFLRLRPRGFVMRMAGKEMGAGRPGA